MLIIDSNSGRVTKRDVQAILRAAPHTSRELVAARQERRSHVSDRRKNGPSSYAPERRISTRFPTRTKSRQASWSASQSLLLVLPLSPVPQCSPEFPPNAARSSAEIDSVPRLPAP